MFIVMVDFAVETTESEKVVEIVRDLLERLVCRQPGFECARLHREVAGGRVVNYMQWRDRQSFDDFRSRHKEEVTAAISPFNPRFGFFEVARNVSPLTS